MVGLLYLPFVALAILVGQALFLAHIRGNGVRVGAGQLPDLQRRIERAAQQLGLAQVPEVYVVQAGGVLNAFATKFLSRRFVILYSELLDACDRLGMVVVAHSERVRLWPHRGLSGLRGMVALARSHQGRLERGARCLIQGT